MTFSVPLLIQYNLTLETCHWEGSTLIEWESQGQEVDFFVWNSVELGPVFNYSPRTGRVEVYALYGNVIDYNCPLNINQVY